MKFNKAVDKYLHTRQFNSLSSSSQKNYECCLLAFCRMSVMGRKLGNVNLDKLSIAMCSEIYDTWELETSTSHANHNARVFSVLINYLIAMEIMMLNPMARVKKRHSEPRSVVWTHDQVLSFLDVAFTKFEWRNIGLIVLMCYEWGQRPIDIRNLTWNDVDLEKRVVEIKQTKRGAEVELPIPDNLVGMLTEQKGDWDFQEYVVPHHRASDGAYRPLTVHQMSALLAEVKALAGLPDDLRVGDLRKTAIVQMIEGEVDHLAIQSVTGHKHVSSLNPYNKFSLKTAKSALERRQRQ